MEAELLLGYSCLSELRKKVWVSDFGERAVSVPTPAMVGAMKFGEITILITLAQPIPTVAAHVVEAADETVVAANKDEILLSKRVTYVVTGLLELVNPYSQVPRCLPQTCPLLLHPA